MNDLNGASQRIANNALVLLAARLMAVIGVPIALGFAVWLSSATLETSKAVIRIDGNFEKVAAQVISQEKRLDRIERFVDGAAQR